MPAESTSVICPNIFDKYANRDEEMQNWCLADYAALTKKNGVRTKPMIIRYVRYALTKDAGNYYREQCLLFLPWRNEHLEIESNDCKTLYEYNKETIDTNRSKYAIIADETMDEVLENFAKPTEINDEEYTVSSEQYQSVDLFSQAGKKDQNEHSTKSQRDMSKYYCPQRITKDEILNIIQCFNEKQLKIFMHILKWIRERPHEPMYIFISGPAGVGKSTVINAIHQMLTHHYDNLPGANPESIKVLINKKIKVS